MQKINLRTYFNILADSFMLTFRNLHIYTFMTLFWIAFYYGMFLLSKGFIKTSVMVFLLLTLFTGPAFYFVGCIVMLQKISLRKLFSNYMNYYKRANIILFIWAIIFFFMNQFVVTPLTIVQSKITFYLIVIPANLGIFLLFNTLPENIYLSEGRIDNAFINSMKFMEDNWIVWSIITLVQLLLLNYLDHRLSAMPTLGSIESLNLYSKLQDISFYLWTLTFTLFMIFRGKLYLRLSNTRNLK